MEDENYFTEQLDGKRTAVDFQYTKHFTIERVNENVLYYWLKNNLCFEVFALPDRDKVVNFSQIIQESQIDSAINRHELDGRNLRKSNIQTSTMITDNLINSTVIKDHNTKVAQGNTKKPMPSEKDFAKDKRKNKKNCEIF